jgi:hypothetical protein
MVTHCIFSICFFVYLAVGAEMPFPDKDCVMSDLLMTLLHLMYRKYPGGSRYQRGEAHYASTTGRKCR